MDNSHKYCVNEHMTNYMKLSKHNVLHIGGHLQSTKCACMNAILMILLADGYFWVWHVFEVGNFAAVERKLQVLQFSLSCAFYNFVVSHFSFFSSKPVFKFISMFVSTVKPVYRNRTFSWTHNELMWFYEPNWILKISLKCRIQDPYK